MALSEKKRWRIAMFLDRSRRFCWSDLVHWAMRLDDDKTLRDCMSGRECAADRDTMSCGSCYCGKFRRPGGDA